MGFFDEVGDAMVGAGRGMQSGLNLAVTAQNAFNANEQHAQQKKLFDSQMAEIERQNRLISIEDGVLKIAPTSQTGQSWARNKLSQMAGPDGTIRYADFMRVSDLIETPEVKAELLPGLKKEKTMELAEAKRQLAINPSGGVDQTQIKARISELEEQISRIDWMDTAFVNQQNYNLEKKYKEDSVANDRIKARAAMISAMRSGSGDGEKTRVDLSKKISEETDKRFNDLWPELFKQSSRPMYDKQGNPILDEKNNPVREYVVFDTVIENGKPVQKQRTANRDEIQYYRDYYRNQIEKDVTARYKRLLGYEGGGDTTTSNQTQSNHGKAPGVAPLSPNETITRPGAATQPNAPAQPTAAGRTPTAAVTGTGTQKPPQNNIPPPTLDKKREVQSGFDTAANAPRRAISGFVEAQARGREQSRINEAKVDAVRMAKAQFQKDMLLYDEEKATELYYINVDKFMNQNLNKKR